MFYRFIYIDSKVYFLLYFIVFVFFKRSNFAPANQEELIFEFKKFILTLWDQYF